MTGLFDLRILNYTNTILTLSSEIDNFFNMIFVLYLCHRIFHPVTTLFFPNQFLGEFLSSPIEEFSERTWCASNVARVIRELK